MRKMFQGFLHRLLFEEFKAFAQSIYICQCPSLVSAGKNHPNDGLKARRAPWEDAAPSASLH